MGVKRRFHNSNQFYIAYKTQSIMGRQFNSILIYFKKLFNFSRVSW